MKKNYFFIAILASVLTIVPKLVLATNIQIEINNDHHKITLTDLDKLSMPDTIELSDDAKDIQAMRIQRNNTTYIVALVWQQYEIDLYLYNTTGEELSSKQVFQADHDNGKDFSVTRLAATTVDNEPLLQARVNKIVYDQPTKLLRKRYVIDPSSDTPIALAESHKKTIAYPDLTEFDSETAGKKLFNYERLAAGLLPVKRSDTLDNGCAKHVEYLRLNNVLTHTEDPAKPGYTAEGNTAGQNSNLAERSTTDMSASILLWTTAIYHRLPMLLNGMNTFGWAVSSRSNDGYYYSCLNVWGGSDLYIVSGDDDNVTYYDVNNFEPIPYPGVNQQHIPPVFDSGEIPDPIAAFGADYPVGQPISLTFSDSDIVTNMAATLTDENNQSIAGYFRAPDDPADPNSTYQGNSVTFIPMAPLHNKITYQVNISGQRNGTNYSKTWQFRTE